jgi:hypothetical protein
MEVGGQGEFGQCGSMGCMLLLLLLLLLLLSLLVVVVVLVVLGGREHACSRPWKCRNSERLLEGRTAGKGSEHGRSDATGTRTRNTQYQPTMHPPTLSLQAGRKSCA